MDKDQSTKGCYTNELFLNDAVPYWKKNETKSILKTIFIDNKYSNKNFPPFDLFSSIRFAPRVLRLIMTTSFPIWIVKSFAIIIISRYHFGIMYDWEAQFISIHLKTGQHIVRGGIEQI